MMSGETETELSIPQPADVRLTDGMALGVLGEPAAELVAGRLTMLCRAHGGWRAIKTSELKAADEPERALLAHGLGWLRLMGYVEFYQEEGGVYCAPTKGLILALRDTAP